MKMWNKSSSCYLILSLIWNILRGETHKVKEDEQKTGLHYPQTCYVTPNLLLSSQEVKHLEQTF